MRDIINIQAYEIIIQIVTNEKYYIENDSNSIDFVQNLLSLNDKSINLIQIFKKSLSDQLNLDKIKANI